MIDVPGEPRSVAEMRFAVGLHPCAGCGSRDTGALEVRGGGRGPAWIYRGPCPRCGTVREVRFRVRRDPTAAAAPPLHHLGGPEPSNLIQPAQFAAELERVASEIVREPEKLAPADWRANLERAHHAATCVTELSKFAGADPLLRIERGRYLMLIDRHAADASRILALESATSPPRPPPSGELSSRTLESHLQWLRRGRTGEGRLEIAHADVRGVKVGAKDFSWSRLEGVVLDGADASFSSFDHAELIGVRMVAASLGSCSFIGARLSDCDLSGADLALARFDDARIIDSCLDRARLDRGLWRGVCVRGVSLHEADFGNAALDDAVFIDCDFRGASFSLHTENLLGTTGLAMFQQCDLRDTAWAGRELQGTVFLECRFHGTRGRPARIDDVVIRGPDLSAAGDGGLIGRREDVVGLWVSRRD